MKLCDNQTGSALIFLLLVLTLIGLLFPQRSRMCSLSADVIAMRVRSYKHQWAVRALLQYGIAWSKKHHDQLLTTSLSHTWNMKWPLDNEMIDAQLQVGCEKGHVTVTAFLFKNKEKIVGMSAILVLNTTHASMLQYSTG
jgi:hypothetical protein